MENNETFFAEEGNPLMDTAFKKAQDSFGYFWRELSWEYRRIIPALDLACIKIAFSQEIDGEEITEHMWINEIDFDGENIYGILINTPNELTNVENGDEVTIPLSQISDWLFATQNKTYGGFTIQAMRSELSDEERADHDAAWGLNFGDYNDILIAFQQKEHPENLKNHPMDRNMQEKLEEFLKGNPEEITAKDENGLTMLHRESIAGNKHTVELLLKYGADKNVLSASGKKPIDYARTLNWQSVTDLLAN